MLPVPRLCRGSLHLPWGCILLQKAPIQSCLCWVFLLHLLANIIFLMSFLSWLEPVWFNEGCCCQQGSGYVWWNRHLNLPLQMGSVQHPDMTLVKVLCCVTFPLYLSPFCVAALLPGKCLSYWKSVLSSLPLSGDIVSVTPKLLRLTPEYSAFAQSGGIQCK